MYKLIRNPHTEEVDSVRKNLDGGYVICIPFDPNNTDYQKFKSEAMSRLQDADGSTMTQDQAQEYLKTIP